jgi:host factor-I protein
LTTPQQGKSRAPEATFEEAKYLKQMIEAGHKVRVKMEDNEEVEGVIEYYDQSFIRLTRDGQPNLFIFKHDIKYIEEAS